MKKLLLFVCVVSAIFGCGGDNVDELPLFGGKGKGNNISNYKTVRIGTQVWMAEDLDYAVEGSKCYDNNAVNCGLYGRLYNWATAMNLPSSCNSNNACSSQTGSPHRGICPSGWHIPSSDEWEVLMNYVGGSFTAGKKLKATSGWYGGGNGTDEFGFSALPGGYGYLDGSFSNAGYRGYWWSSSEDNSNIAYYRDMRYGYEYAYWYNNDKSLLFSVRCLQDY